MMNLKKIMLGFVLGLSLAQNSYGIDPATTRAQVHIDLHAAPPAAAAQSGLVSRAPQKSNSLADLFQAIVEDDVEKVLELIDQDVSLHARDDVDYSALTFALDVNKIRLVRIFILRGAWLNDPRIQAIHDELLNILLPGETRVEKFLELTGVEFDEKWMACLKRCLIDTRLARKCCSARRFDEYWTKRMERRLTRMESTSTHDEDFDDNDIPEDFVKFPKNDPESLAQLFLATANGDIRKVVDLLSNGVSPVAQDSSGYCAITIALDAGNIGLVRMFLLWGVWINDSRVRLIHSELWNILLPMSTPDHADRITQQAKLFELTGARFNLDWVSHYFFTMFGDRPSRTELMNVTINGLPEDIKRCLDNGAKIDARDHRKDKTALDMALEGGRTRGSFMLMLYGARSNNARFEPLFNELKSALGNIWNSTDSSGSKLHRVQDTLLKLTGTVFNRQEIETFLARLFPGGQELLGNFGG